MRRVQCGRFINRPLPESRFSTLSGGATVRLAARTRDEDVAMRTLMVVIALLFGAVAPAFADARILSVDGASPSAEPASPPIEPKPPAPEAVPTPETAPPPRPQAQPRPRAETPAAPAVKDSGPVRFSFETVKEGLLRLDRQTGQVAFCSGRAVGWACEPVPEERAALEKEIARLQDEVAALKRDVAALREPPPPPRPPADLAPRPPAKEGEKPADKDKGGELTLKLPSQEDVDRATAALQRAWDRVLDMIGQLRNDLSRKSPDRTTL